MLFTEWNLTWPQKEWCTDMLQYGWILKYYTKWKKPDTEDHIIYDHVYEMYRTGKSIKLKNELVSCQWLEGGENGEENVSGYVVSFGRWWKYGDDCIILWVY